MQYAETAFIAMNRFKGKGKGKKGKGKSKHHFGKNSSKGPNKGSQKGKGPSKGSKSKGKGPGRGSTNPDIVAAKKKTKCNACGQIGHWQNDPECPARTKPVANMATTTVSSDEDEACSFVADAAAPSFSNAYVATTVEDGDEDAEPKGRRLDNLMEVEPEDPDEEEAATSEPASSSSKPATVAKLKKNLVLVPVEKPGASQGQEDETSKVRPCDR